MTEEDYDAKLDDIHAQLFELYQGGSVDVVLINRLWHRADVLEDAKKLTLKHQEEIQ